MRSVKQIFDLDGKVALVTGGSRGLGLQIAEALGEQGATVVISARKKTELDQAVTYLQSRGIDTHAIAADLADDAAIKMLVTQTMTRYGSIDILVNNAGATWGAPAESHPVEAWDKVMHLNVRSLFLMSQTVAAISMIPRNNGRIVNVASIAGLAGNVPDGMQTIAYNTSKGAVLNFTRALAGEWGRYGITVNSIAPGFFPSKMTHGFLETLGVDKIVSRTPLLRIGDEEDLKGAVVLFSSDAAKYITGQVLAIDGGLSSVH